MLLELIGVAGLVAGHALPLVGHLQHGLAAAGVVTAGMPAVLREALDGLEVATAPGAHVDAGRQRPRSAHGGALAAVEGVEVVDEHVVVAQTQQVDLVLGRGGHLELGLADQVPLEVAGAVPLGLAPVEDVDLAGVGQLEGVDVCPSDSALRGGRASCSSRSQRCGALASASWSCARAPACGQARRRPRR